MAIVAEYRDPAGPHVVIRDDDYAHKTPEQMESDRVAENKVICDVFARGCLASQAACAERYEKIHERASR